MNKEAEIKELAKKLDKIENAEAKDVPSPIDTENSKVMEDSLLHLRRQVKNLKAEINIQQEKRSQLRRQLHDQREKALAQQSPAF